MGTVLIDNKFENLRVLSPILVVNTTAAKEHVPEVETCIHLIKEYRRGILNTLPFRKMPQIILIKPIYHVVLWLLSPRKIVYRHKLDIAMHCKARFSTYYKAHDEPTPTNMMVTCLTSAIVLGPMGDLQGTYKFFNTVTGKKIKQRKLTAYPMLESIIKKVEQFGKSNARPNTLDFADRNGILFEWNNDVKEYPEGLVKEDLVL